MSVSLILISSLFTISLALGQPADSINSNKATESSNNSFAIGSSLLQTFYDVSGNKRWISKEHVIVETTKIRLNSIEEEISELESLECKALLKRDTAALRTIWLRDFTLDAPQNELHLSKNPIPYYVSLHRVIEKITITDNTVLTSSIEYLHRLKDDGKFENPVKQNFTHVWTRKLFTWKLTSKATSEL